MAALVKSFPQRTQRNCEGDPHFTPGGRQPKGASPLDPRFRFFLMPHIRPCSTGRASADPGRPRGSITIQYYPN